MRVAYLLNTYPKPSHSFIRREMQALERQGFEVHRFAMRGERAALVDPLDIREDQRTEHVLNGGAGPILSAIALNFLTNPRSSFAALRLAVRAGRRSDKGTVRHLAYFAEACYVVRRLAARRIPHLHAHFGTNSATVAMLVGVLGDLSWSFTVHGPEEFDGPLSLSLDQKIRRSAFAVAVSAFGRSQLCRWADYHDWQRLHVVHCGIEAERFAAPAAMPPRGPAGETRLVTAGRIVEQKGHLLLVEALARAVARGSRLHLTLVGDGEMRGTVEAALRAHRIESRVTITGWLDEARVRAELSAAHAFVMPSFAEGLPMVVMEAMASCRPVAATLVAGIPELVRDGETGWLFPAGDVDALADVLEEIAATPDARLADLGAAGRQRVLERHDVDREAARLAALFRRTRRDEQVLAAEAGVAPVFGSRDLKAGPL